MKRKIEAKDIATLDDGKVGLAIDKELRAVVDDCMDRPGLVKPRAVTIKLAVVPQIGEDGVCEAVVVDAVVHHSKPPRQSRPMQMAVRGNGDLIFNDASPDDVRQSTLDETG